jgi:hypothetical protein
MNANWKDRLNKDVVRERVMTHAQQQLGAVKTYLCLPGWDEASGEAGQCVQMGIRMGVITPTTKVIGYEYDPEIIGNIRRFFKEKYPDYDITVHKGRLEDSEFDPGSVDFAFLDFTGNMNEDTYFWLAETLAPALTGNAVVAITQPFGRAIPPLYKTVKHRLATDLTQMRTYLMDQFELWEKLKGQSKESNPWGRNTLMVIGLSIVKCALREYHARVARRFMVYHDGMHIPMYAMIFDQIHRRDDSPIFPELILRKETTMTNRSKAAFKAHATRRANALAAKRSAAARKAWRTRRAQA